MTKAPMFSVVVPTYGRQKYLLKAIDSILAQTVRDFECIVVDDASPDPAEVPSDHRVRLLRRSTNGGWPAARNTGINVARGRYIAFLDDDDTFTPNRLALGIEGMERAPISICWRRGSDGSTSGNHVLEGDVSDTILDALTPQIGQVTLRREVFIPFDERFSASADIDWWIRLAQTAPVATVAEVGLIYRMHDGPRHGNGIEARVRSGHMLLEVHADYFARHPRAEAFRWKRIGLYAQRLGDRTHARSAFVRSLRLHPEPQTVVHLARTLLPSARRGAG